MTHEERNAYAVQKNTARRERRRAAGLCYQCGEPLPDGWKPGTRCPACAESQREYHRELYAERQKMGLCVYCGKPAQRFQVSCAMCARKRHDEYVRRKDRQERRTV